MRHVGMQGFVEATDDAVKATAAFAAAVRDIPELALLGDPLITTVAFKSIKSTVPIFKVRLLTASSQAAHSRSVP